MKSIKLLFALLFFVLFAPAQTTVTITAAADNTVYQSPNTSSNALGQNMLCGTNGGGSPRRGLVKFDLASLIPPGAMIINATLTLHCNQSRAIPDDVFIYKLSNNWGEGTSNAGSAGDGGGVPATTNDATWLSRFFPGELWATAGGDYMATASAGVNIASVGSYNWSGAGVTADVQSWINNPTSNFGWILICNEASLSTARKFGSKENTSVANRPSLSVTYTTVLPVELRYFKVQVSNNTGYLTWETSSELRNRFFEIMHSTNGSDFSSIGRVDRQNNSTATHLYAFTHKNISPGFHFYKLRQVDLDGRQTFSTIQRIYNPLLVAVFPNPVSEVIKIQINGNLHALRYIITNVVGHIVLQGAVSNAEIRTHALSAGLYQLRLFHHNDLFTQTSFLKL